MSATAGFKPTDSVEIVHADRWVTEATIVLVSPILSVEAMRADLALLLKRYEIEKLEARRVQAPQGASDREVKRSGGK